MMQKISTNEQNINQFTYMRIIGCFSIIVLHSLFASVIYFQDEMLPKDKAVEAYCEHLLMWGVPIFIMITGALLLNPQREITLKKLFYKYINRILLALISFTFIFQGIDYCFGEEKTVFVGGIKNLLFGTGWAHMWYLYLMVAIYLMVPVYKIIADKASDKEQRYFIFVLALFTSILPMVEALGYNLGFSLPTQSVYPLYIFLGYYIYKNPIKLSYSVVLLVMASVAIIMATACGDLEDTSINEFLRATSQYYSILVVIQATSIFNIFLNIKLGADKFIMELDKSTFGIYLIHMIGIRYIMKWQGINPYEYGPGFFFLLAVFIFFVSFIIVFLLRKIPKLNLL